MRGWRRTAALVVGGGLASLSLTAASPLAAAQEDPAPEQVEQGRRLYTTGCSSCHGIDAEGTRRGPSLQGVGAASVDFWVSTGRMPLKTERSRAVRKPPAYSREQIDAIVAYVTSIAPGGPDIPELDLAEAD
ncbi:MAG: c-type cytochrome, partial [Acidimicrobiales bacterium]